MTEYANDSNPIIRHKFTSDPTVLVYNNTVYLYTGHDEAPAGSHNYLMNDWLCFSSPDLRTWEEHPVPLAARDFTWAAGDAYASKVIYHNKLFYWYAAVTHAGIPGKAIAVAISNKPTGPFKDARGTALIDQQMIPDKDRLKVNMDPTVIVDADNQAYIIWGKELCYFAKLKPNLTEIDGEIKRINLPGFAEGAHIHYRDSWYYLSYGYGFPEKVGYAMSKNITGPWQYKGILNEIPGNCETNRPAIINFRGKDLFFYHNGSLPEGGSHRRSVCVDELFYNPDGTMKRIIMTSEGVQL